MATISQSIQKYGHKVSGGYISLIRRINSLSIGQKCAVQSTDIRVNSYPTDKLNFRQ
jgi:hypothetical protein